MICMRCNDRQPIGASCRSCGEAPAAYYCGICHLFDDEPGRDIYHCPFCNVCRRGKVHARARGRSHPCCKLLACVHVFTVCAIAAAARRIITYSCILAHPTTPLDHTRQGLGKGFFHCTNCNCCMALGLPPTNLHPAPLHHTRQGLGKDFFHCMNCNCCMALGLAKGHACRERSLEATCPVCSEYLFDSCLAVKVRVEIKQGWCSFNEGCVHKIKVCRAFGGHLPGLLRVPVRLVPGGQGACLCITRGTDW